MDMDGSELSDCRGEHHRAPTPRGLLLDQSTIAADDARLGDGGELILHSPLDDQPGAKSSQLR
jgi:hypothetical protein